jgi:hypothetical protein
MLHDAAKSGSDVLVRMLLEKGADREIRDNTSSTVEVTKSDGVRAVFKEGEFVLL